MGIDFAEIEKSIKTQRDNYMLTLILESNVECVASAVDLFRKLQDIDEESNRAYDNLRQVKDFIRPF